MAQTTAIQRQLQSLAPGHRVMLFKIDLTKLGGGSYYFTQTAFGTEPLYFGGIAYQPIDMEVSDFEVNAGGALPTPTIKLANNDQLVSALINTFGDLLGAKVSRVRTFAQFLDGQPEADPAAYLGPDHFEIERKTEETKEYVEWQLSASIDQEGKMLPGRVVVRDTCMWRYRTFNKATSTFDYHLAQCPYTGGACFDRSGNPANADKDECGRRVSDCELRFGKNNPLPFGGFPGVARVRS